jgi:hypothetical protein
MTIRPIVYAAILLTSPLMTTGGFTQAAEPSQTITFPANAKALEGLPQVRVDASKDNVTRRLLNPSEAVKSRLTIKIDKGRLYWAGQPLKVWESGSYTYLSSTEPGRYVRIQWLKDQDKLAYVEHVDMTDLWVTYWGEMRVVLDK